MKRFLFILAVRLVGVLSLAIGGGIAAMLIAKTSWRMVGLWWLSLFSALSIVIYVAVGCSLLVIALGPNGEGEGDRK